MSTINVNQLPGQGARRTASPRTPILSDEQLFPGGLIIDGTLSRDTGNTGDLDVLRAGNIMGRITASKKFRPSIIGLTTVLHDTSAVTVTMTLPAEIVTELGRLRALGATTFKIAGPPAAAGVVAVETVTYTAEPTATTITITATAADFAVDSLIQPPDGGEDMMGIIHNGTGLKVTDEDKISQDADFPDAVVSGGVVDSDQLIHWPTDASVIAYIKAQLRLNSAGFVFDDDFNG